jgi:hypothetical protein
LALWLLIGNFALGLGSVGEDYGRSPVEASVSLVMGVAVSAFLLSKLAKGRNWARILVVAFVAISWLVLIVAVSQGRPLTLMAYVRAMLQTICIALLCLGSGAAWFREVRTSGRRSPLLISKRPW